MRYVPLRCRLDDILREQRLDRTYISDRAPHLSRQNISDYARNRRRMSLATAKTIAAILDCSIDDLYEWTLR